MPSQARLTFQNYMLADVNRLREMHREQFAGRGRPLSVLTRSGVFLLCAAWEFYCEELALESFEHMLGHTAQPLDLPERLRRTLANALKSEKNELAPLRLAGDGWQDYLREKIRTRVEHLNTPTAENVSELFHVTTGVDVTEFFEPHAPRLREFVSKRGDIAHRGAQAGHVSINDIDEDYDYICRLVVDLDNHVIEPIQHASGRRPWNRRA